MSCEHLIEQLEAKVETLPVMSKERLKPALLAQYLTNSCRTGESRITHTSKLLNAQLDSEMDELWLRNKKEAEAYLSDHS